MSRLLSFFVGAIIAQVGMAAFDYVTPEQAFRALWWQSIGMLLAWIALRKQVRS